MKAGPYIQSQYEYELQMAEMAEQLSKKYMEKSLEHLAAARKHRETAARWADGTNIVEGE